MKKHKTNNLFVKGKRAAAIALLVALPFAQAKAYDERAYMTPGEQTEYQTYGVLPSDIDNNKKDTLLTVLGCLGMLAIPSLMVVIGCTVKDKKLEKHLQQNQNQK